MDDQTISIQTDPSRVLGLLTKALDGQSPMAKNHIERLRRRHPGDTPRQVIGRLNNELRAATISAGMGVGAAAAAPGVGTGIALTLSGAELLGFFNASALYILARSEVHGIRPEDVERRRTLVMAVMMGNAGAAGLGTAAERTGPHWARQLVKAIPMEKILAVNKVLGKNFVTKYGTKQGILVLGRVIPFGIGAVIGGVGNGFFCQGIITASNRAFGEPPLGWET